MAGYGAVWLPPVGRGYVPPGQANQNSTSAGYDVFDRFNLGTPQAQTAYGTEDYFRAVVGELHQADVLVYIDAVLNHNSSRQTSAAFQTEGGYPGFWMAPANPPVNKTPTSAWGDFHAGVAGGYLQSENPLGPRYDLYNGDLVALIDIDQFTHHYFIRHPVDASNPQNIPGGTYFNRPNPANRRFYPDAALPQKVFTNPAIRGKPAEQHFIHPFNTVDPMQGDPTIEDVGDLLQRYIQWMLDELKVDGFRMDAIKHVPSIFWDRDYDAAVFERRRTPDGRFVTPFTFGESVEGNSFTYNNFIRKDGFGNRDCLDLNGAGQLRDISNAGGFGSWLNVLQAHLDNADDSDNNGSIGVNHVFSHDNGTTGDGNSAPANPTERQYAPWTQAYVLTRPGAVKLYHNARGITRSGGFWPRQGIPAALGVNPVTNVADATITRLVQLHNFYIRGAWNVLNTSDMSDVLIYERRVDTGGGVFSGHVLIGVNDRYDSGFDQRTVTTSFPAGTRLVEMTGNSSSAQVDPNNDLADVLTVGAGGQVTIRVPRNRSSAGEHNKGYVVYGLPIANGTLSLSNIASTIPADPAGAPSVRRRMTAVPVITSDTFQILLTTTNGDPGGIDQNSDDNAIFRIDQGYRDFNGSGSHDIPHTNAVCGGYEQFVTLRQPLYNSGQPTGNYAQTIDGSLLADGYHYVSVLSFRHRNANDAPVFREFRTVFYLDRQCPPVALLPVGPLTSTNVTLNIKSLDRTANRVHVIQNPPSGVDPVTLATVFNQAVRVDRFLWQFGASGLQNGNNTFAIVAFEDSGRGCSQLAQVFVGLCIADVDDGTGTGTPDGGVTIEDLLHYLNIFDQGLASADVDDGSGTGTQDGGVTIEDLLYFLLRFDAGC